MKKMYITLVLAMSMLMANAQSFNSNLATMLQDTLTTYVNMLGNVKGMSAAVYIPGQGTWSGTAGISYTGQPITSDMKFGIASNTKLFVATVMLMLQEDGLVDLDDSVSSYLPNYPNVNPDISIRQLLNHTSGVSDPIFVSPWMDTIAANPTRVFTPNEVLGWLGAPVFAPGNGWNYSNVNYILAGMIAQNITGHHIAELIRDSILTPLNMDSTFYDVQEAETGIVSHRWYNSIDYNDTSRVGLNTAGGCAGSVFSTSSEMAQWYHALFSGQVINAASLTELTTFIGTGNPVYDYALGLDRSTTQGIKYWGHGGSTWGYRSKLMYDTCMGTVVCGLSNCWPSGQDGITFLLYRVVRNHVPRCAGALSGSTIVCQGTSGVVYTVPPIQNATSYVWTLPAGATGTSNTNSITVDFSSSATSGTIMVSGVNNFGAGGNASLGITVNPTPPTPVITQNNNTLTSGAPAGNQWYNTAGMLPGETGQNYNVTVNGDYYTIVTLSGCSSDTSNIIHVIVTGIAANPNNAPFLVYPNPVRDILTLQFAAANGNDEIVVSDMTGRIVLRERSNGNRTQQLRVETLPAGVYQLQTGTTRVRFVKQ